MKSLFQVALFLILFTLNCTEQEPVQPTVASVLNDIKAYKKWPKFSNSTLMFGNALSEQQLAILGIAEPEEDTDIYSALIYSVPFDSVDCDYLIYGEIRKDSVVEKLRIRSFQEEEQIADVLLIDFNKYEHVTYDYFTRGDYLLVISTNENGDEHFADFELHGGQITPLAMLPDSVFGESGEFVFEVGREVVIYDDYLTKELTLGNQKRIYLEGKVLENLSGKGVGNWTLVQLEDSILGGLNFALLKSIKNRPLSLRLLNSGEVSYQEYGCLFGCRWPVEEPRMFKEIVYLDYKD